MSRLKPPDYSGIFLESEQIRYEDIDPPLSRLIRLINDKPWVKTYGCCAGPAHHRESSGHGHQFFIGLLVDEASAGTIKLRKWLDEANRINGSTGLRAEMEYLHKHPFGQGMVGGWSAYRVTAYEIRKSDTPLPPQTYLRLVKCLETAWSDQRDVPE